MSSASHIANNPGFAAGNNAEIPGGGMQDETCRILAEASHDLRQPVQALGLHVAELRRKISSREQQQLVGQVERSIDAISALIDALFDISRLNAGTVAPSMQACDLSALLERIEADFQGMACARNIRLVVRPCRCTVRSDPVLLERIVMNLVGNALRYSRDDGTVLIACRKRVGHILLEVRDNGIGIEKSHQADIFREFFHLSDDHQPGLGLGLAIVDRLSKSLGHKVTLRSAPGQGSTFTLQLGCTRRAFAAPLKTPKYRCCTLTGKKVLVAMHDAATRDEIAGMLAGWGCATSAASSIKSLVRLSASVTAWDLVVCDSWMSADLVALRPEIKTPRIQIGTACCGAPEPGMLSLGKPVKPAKLRSLVRFALDAAAACN